MAGARERGVVVAVREGEVDVRLKAGAACANCSACCHVDTDGVLAEGARDPLGASLGDEVEIEIPEGADTRAGVLVFVLPAIGLLAGYALGALVSSALGASADLGGAIGAVLAIVAALLVLRSRGRALPDDGFRPVVRAIIPRTPATPSTAEGGSNQTP